MRLGSTLMMVRACRASLQSLQPSPKPLATYLLATYLLSEVPVGSCYRRSGDGHADGQKTSGRSGRRDGYL